MFEIFGRTASYYGVMMLLGFLAGLLLALYRAKKDRFPLEDTFYVCLIALVGAILGSKLLYLAVTGAQLALAGVPLWKLETIEFLLGGSVFYGGLLMAVLGAWIYCRAYRIGFLEMADRLAPSAAIAHMFGRIGCFLAGCCYGIPIPPPLGVRFPYSLTAPHVHLLPVQLFESAANLALCAALCLFRRKDRKPGSVVAAYLVSYAAVRFVVEFFRYDAIRGVFFLSTSQWISLVLFGAVYAVGRSAGVRSAGQGLTVKR